MKKHVGQGIVSAITHSDFYKELKKQGWRIMLIDGAISWMVKD